ncbi:hypothetical protein L9F63_013691, partial [Diploptera punctata]
MELVKFINVKPKYCLNDDILLEYILDTKFQSTYRDFIGLYARGWNDLVQYITFEWIITHPNESSARRSTLFKSRYHSESVKLDVEYQFVYIDYKIEVMGRSQYFRFVPAADSIGNCKKNLQRGLSEIALTPSITLHSDPLSHVLLAPKPSSSVTKLDGYHRAPCFTQPQDQHLRGFSSEIALASAELPTFCTISAPNQKTMPCSICNQQFASHDHQKPDNKVKSSAAWINDLEHRNRSLEDRIQDLENELEMSLVTQKNLRLAAHHSKRDKLAYQKFVNELLHALSQKGIARVVDGQGTEMLVKRIPMKVPPADNSEERPVQNGGKTSSRERYLKAIIGSQEQKIRDLMLHLEATTKACHNLSLKMDLVADKVIRETFCSRRSLRQQEVCCDSDDEIEKMQSQFNTEREQTKNQILALKEVANICKEMLSIREGQLSIDLRSEYETQMENIRTLKNLYEERMKLMLSEKEKLVQDSEEKSQLLDAEIKKSAKFEQELADTKLSLEEKEEHNSNLQIQLDDSHDKSHGLAKELTLINNLFTQMLTGTTATDMDLDRLTRLLQENHDLITDITIKEDSSEVDSGITSPSSSPTGERNDDTPQTCASATTDDSSTSHIKTSNEESVNDSESLPNNESSNIEENCSEDDTQYEDISDCRIDSPKSSSRAVESQTQSARLNRTPEEIAEARAERLKRLEEQCQQLYNKVTRTTHRSTALCNRLEELHEQFRTSESPPRYRNNSNRSPLNCIPGTPPFVSSSENPSPSTSPLPRLQSDMCQLPNVPVPPPLPHHLLTVRIPTCHELPEVPRPPPLPAVLPSTRIPTASILRGTNQLDSSNSVNETTRHETQSQQQQDLDSTDTSTEDHFIKLNFCSTETLS